MQEVVLLYWNDINLGELSFEDGNYTFAINEANATEAAQEGCPMLFDDCASSKELPVIFHEFDISKGRTDLAQELGIEPSDNEFERICKIAKKYKKFSTNGFWIKS